MRTRTKVVSIIALFSIAAVGALSLSGGDARESGRTDPKRAAAYRPPLFNFSEIYREGAALGIAVGSTKAQAIAAAERAGLTVEPSGWGDDRAGGADLYKRPKLLSAMLRQPYLNFYDPNDLKGGVTVNFQGGRVVAIRVHYINFEAF